METEKTNKIIEYSEPDYKLKLITGDEIYINTNNPCKIVVTKIDYNTTTLHAFLIVGHIAVDLATIDFTKNDMDLNIQLSEIVYKVQTNPEKFKGDLYESIIELNTTLFDTPLSFKLDKFKKAFVKVESKLNN